MERGGAIIYDSICSVKGLLLCVDSGKQRNDCIVLCMFEPLDHKTPKMGRKE